MSVGLLDTSVIVGAPELASELPEQAAISVITLGELRAGVIRAQDDAERSRRSARLEAVRESFLALPVDEQVAFHYGELLAWARSRGRSQKGTDLLITATAAATDRKLFTRDGAQAGLASDASVPVELLRST